MKKCRGRPAPASSGGRRRPNSSTSKADGASFNHTSPRRAPRATKRAGGRAPKRGGGALKRPSRRRLGPLDHDGAVRLCRGDDLRLGEQVEHAVEVGLAGVPTGAVRGERGLQAGLRAGGGHEGGRARGGGAAEGVERRDGALLELRGGCCRGGG
jgi:hypothetical protein